MELRAPNLAHPCIKRQWFKRSTGQFGATQRDRYISCMFGLPRTHERPRNVRLDTLIRLRWLAVCGQLSAVLVVHFGLEFEVPIWLALQLSLWPRC